MPELLNDIKITSKNPVSIVNRLQSGLSANGIEWIESSEAGSLILDLLDMSLSNNGLSVNKNNGANNLLH